jgi:hypothetical protein
MPGKLVRGPVSKAGNLHFWAEYDAGTYLCLISKEALADDYRDGNSKEVFNENSRDILRRAERLLPIDPKVVDGIPTVVIRSGEALK